MFILLSHTFDIIIEKRKSANCLQIRIDFIASVIYSVIYFVIYLSYVAEMSLN